MEAPKSILVRCPNWIGDQILAYPFFYYLRKAYPQAHIAAVCVAWVKDLQFKTLVDEVHVLSRPGVPGLWAKIENIEEEAKALKASRKWDWAITLPNSLSSAWMVHRAGATRKRGYRVDGRGLLLNEALDWDPSPERHRAQAYVDLLPQEVRPSRNVKEFWGVPPANELDLGIPGELEVFDAIAEWAPTEVIEPLDEPYWVLAPGATADSRRWPLEYFIHLARQVVEETGWRGVIVGGPGEAVIAARLCDDRSLRLRDLTAQGPVSGLWKIFTGAKFTVCNESGLAHMAALCGSFTQIVCGAADPRRTRPIGPGRVQVAINPVECWPCERNTCSQEDEKKLQCLRGIKPDLIWGEIKRGTRR